MIVLKPNTLYGQKKKHFLGVKSFQKWQKSQKIKLPYLCTYIKKKEKNIIPLPNLKWLPLLVFALYLVRKFGPTKIYIESNCVQCNIFVKFSAVQSTKLVGLGGVEQWKKWPNILDLATAGHQSFLKGTQNRQNSRPRETWPVLSNIVHTGISIYSWIKNTVLHQVQVIYQIQPCVKLVKLRL